MKQFLLIALTVSALFSCANSGGKGDNNIVDGHNAYNALDWDGVYYGVLPCADCEGIETELTLNKDLTYTLITNYLGKEEALGYELQGSFTWEGNNIKLDGIKKEEGSALYKVEENRVRHLDLEGNVITGDLEHLYILKKLGNLMVEDKRWELVELNGKEIKGKPETHFIVFHSKKRHAEAKANCNVLILPYRIVDQLMVKFEHGISTLMACPDNLEQEFLEVLHIVDNLSTDGKTLTLNKARMAPLARFKLVE